MKFMVLFGFFSIQFFISCEFQVKVINLIKLNLFWLKKRKKFPCDNCILSPCYEKNSCDGLWVSSVAWKWLQNKCTGQNGSLLFPYHPRNLLRMYIDPSNNILLLTELLCSFRSLDHISLPSSSCTAVSLLSPILGGGSPETIFHI